MKRPQPGEAEAAGGFLGYAGGRPGTTHNDQIAGLFLASAVIRSLALPAGRAFYLQLHPAPEMLFSGRGLFVGDVGWSIAASNTLLSKVSNAAHGSGRSNWTKGPLNPAPPKRGLLQ